MAGRPFFRTMLSRYQIAIIGGGPGGLAAALAACRAGAESVVVIERKRRWGVPVQCAGYVPRSLARAVELDARAVRAVVDKLDVHLDGVLLRSIRAPGYVLRRDVFERRVAEAVQEAGATCLQPARALHIRDNTVTVEAHGERTAIEAKIIIAADGPRSLVRRTIGLPDPKTAAGLQWEMPMARPASAAEVHLSHAYGAGYAWLFPHGDTAGVGLALDADRSRDMSEMLRAFVGQMVVAGKLRPAEPTTVVSGTIPVSGPVGRTVLGNIVLVGDAAGQTNPLTGAGIMAALTCGEMAGRAAAQAAKADDLSLLQRYEHEWRDLLEGFLARALRARAHVAEAPPERFPEQLRNAWLLGEDAG